MNRFMLYTIGYSSHTIDSIIGAIKLHAVDAVADVRTTPFSKFKPEFNQPILTDSLKRSGVKYVFLGKECGARIKDSDCYVDGRANFAKISVHPLFLNGLNRIESGLEKMTIVLLCAEKDPIDCHRTILIGRNLRNRKINVNHILSDCTIETQAQIEKRLLKKFKLDAPDLFSTESQRIERAYDLQGIEIASGDNLSSST